jgi:hypothetical protein
MKGQARNFFTLAVLHFLFGIAVGLYMAISANHTQHVSHAHIMLVGWVTSALFAFFYHLCPAVAARAIAKVHFWLHAASSAVMLVSLLLLYGGNPSFEPGAAGGSLVFGASVLLFAFVALPAIWKE